MRASAVQLSTLQRYGNILASHQKQLGSIQDEVSNGNTRLCDQLTSLEHQRDVSIRSETVCGPQTLVRSSKGRFIGNKGRRQLRFRFPPLHWLTSWTWELAMSRSQGSWTFDVHPINYRPIDTPAFDYVRKGNVVAIEKLFREGELSIWDFAWDEELGEYMTLLKVLLSLTADPRNWHQTDG